MKKTGKYLLLALSLTLIACLIAPVSVMAKMVRNVDNLFVLVDTSGSMSEDHAELNQKKIDAAIDLVSRFDQAVPELGHKAALYTVAPLEEIAPLQTYQNGALDTAAGEIDTDFGLTGRLTPLGSGLKDMGKVIASGVETGGEPMPLTGKTAIVLLTDGESNVGADPIPAAQALYDQFPEVCVHAISLADTAEGQQVIDGITGLSSCSASGDVNSLATQRGMEQFAQKVLYTEVAAAPAPAPEPVVETEVITFNLLFGFDKAQITGEMIPVLEQAQMILEDDPDAEFIVAGHTDSVGTEAYNQGLSERRAQAVSNWMIENGVDARRLEVVGYGETMPKFDNTTEEGRALNRRVEIMAK